MIKRTAGFVLLIFANILLLAHTVIPHHHHHKQVCFGTSNCINDDFTHEHETNNKSNKSGEDSHPDHCLLKAPFLLFSNQWKTEFKFSNFTSGNSGSDDLFSSRLSSITELQVPVSSPFVIAKFSNCSYSYILSAFPGLRAPPVI